MYAIVCQSVRAPSCSVQGCDGMHVNIPSVVKLREGTAHDNDHLAKKAHTHAQYIYIYIRIQGRYVNGRYLLADDDFGTEAVDDDDGTIGMS